MYRALLTVIRPASSSSRHQSTPPSFLKALFGASRPSFFFKINNSSTDKFADFPDYFVNKK